MRGLVIICCVSGACLYTPRPLDSPDAAGDAAPDASTAGRVANGLIALWLLDDHGGTTVAETSGLPPVALTITDMTQVTWTPDALSVDAPVDINSGFGVVNRLSVACRDSDEVTVEAWVTPAVLDQRGTTPGQPARVITLTTQNIGSHQISLGQLGTSWAAQVDTSAAGVDAHGDPILAAGTTAASATHLVVTANATERRLYVNGVMASDQLGGNLDSWEQMRTVSLGGDPNRRNTWLGTIHLAAMYDRALSPDEVATNLAAGPTP